MKKIMIIATLFAGFSSFANDIKEEKRTIEENTTSKEASTNEESFECCTAYLSYYGVTVDQETVCGFITQGDNCRFAQQRLLDRHKSVNPSGKI